jgi:exopolysaccharide biosynthesis protein
MKYIRKVIAFVLVIALMAMLPISTVMADTNIIHQASVKHTLTSGATLEKITRFTTDGWLGINVLRIDLSNPNVKVDTLTNPATVRKLTNTKALADIKGAIAAINGGFFIWSKDAGMAEPIGPVLEDGKLLTTSTDFNSTSDSMGTFAIDQANQMLLDYWKTTITLTTPVGESIPVGRYNKVYYGHKDLSIYDRRYTTTTIGNENASDLVEMIVENGIVVDIRENQPAVTIPENGYAIVTRGEGKSYLLNNFAPGDPVGLDISTTPDWTKLKMAVTGGAVLLKDGEIPQTFSHDTDKTPKRQPRSAIASSEDGQQLFLVTVDGRQNSSIGMTQLELAQFLQELGAQNALNLDGGGSTTMIARTPGNTALSVANRPSDGSLRNVSSAIGIFSLAPPSELDGLLIDTSDPNVFVNTSRQLKVKGYDRFFNPVEVKPEQIKWSVTGVKGTFKDGTFYPVTSGEAKVKATIGKVSAQFNMSVLTAPVQLELSEKLLKLSQGQKKNLKVTGINKNGYRTDISSSDITWAVKGTVGSISSGTLTAAGQGTGYLSASVGKTKAYCAVSVTTTTTTIKDKFEVLNGKLLVHPESVTGSYTLSMAQKHSGRRSSKLTYDFSQLEGTRAAYVEFKKGGIALDPATDKLGLWVYNDHSNPSWLGAWVYDTDGKQHTVYFTKDINWEGWKYVEVSLQSIKSPAKLTRIYAVQPNPVPDSGSLYFDELTVTVTKSPEFDMKQLPKDTVPVDSTNKSVTYPKGSDAFSFAVFGESYEPGAKETVKKSLLKKLTDSINKNLAAGAFVGSTEHNAAKSLKKPFVATNTGYKAFDVKTSRFIQLDMSKDGLRTSNAEQWRWFLDQLNSFKGNNVFLFMAGTPEGFSDTLEAKLFQDELTRYRQKTGRNIWVFYKGSKHSSYMDRGVKYITTAGFDEEGLDLLKAKTAKYVHVTVKGNTVTYQFKPIQ